MPSRADATPPPDEPTPKVQSKDGVGGGHAGRAKPRHRDRASNRSRIFRELVHIAAEQGATIQLGVSTGDALQECLDRAVALWRFAADQVDKIQIRDPDVDLANLSADEDPTFEVYTNPQGPDLVDDHRWYKREREARHEIEKLAAMMTQLGIAERVVRVEEAKAALVVAAIREAAVDAGIPPDQIRALGAALRERVAEGLQMHASRPRTDPATGTTPRDAYYGANKTEKAINQGPHADIKVPA